MIDENALRQKAALGAKFKEALPDIRDGLDAIEAEYANAWAETFKTEERENLWRAVQVVRRLKDHFGEIVSDGEVSQLHLTEIKRLR